MRQIFTKFIHDEGGAYAMTFGVMAIVLIAFGGASVDFARTQKVRTQAQIALDAATLALHKDMNNLSDAALMQQAEDMILERMEESGLTVTVESVSKDVNTKKLAFQARVTVPTVFLSLVNVDTMPFRIQTEVAQGWGELEVVFVLDNTASMAGQSRLANLKIATRRALDILFADSSNIRVGIVPFAFMVNVGPSNRNQFWMDQNGVSSISDDNFDVSPANRFALYDTITNEDWRGCVEARPHPLDVQDTTPTQSNPDTLIVPSFSPDEPDFNSIYGNSYVSDFGGSCPTSYAQNPQNFPETQRQERYCKYAGETAVYDYDNPNKGPNARCDSIEILPLTTNINMLKNHVNRMDAFGLTNLHMGMMWGWRVLSHNPPFEEGADPAVSDVKKVIIFMTDGKNTSVKQRTDYINGADSYTAYGYPENKRLGDSSYSSVARTNEMDERTRLTCQNAQQSGIEIFVIGLGYILNNYKKLMRNCGSKDENVYFITKSSDLIDVFEAIASQINRLRVSR